MAEVESRTQGSRPRAQKIQGQGHTFRGQILSRPRTGLLKAKDTMRKCSPTKKRATLKIFASFPQTSGDLKKKKKKFPPTNSQIFPKIHASKTFFRKFSGVLQDETTLLMTLAHFLQIKKYSCSCRLRGQGQGLQIVSSRSRTSLRTPPLYFST